MRYVHVVEHRIYIPCGEVRVVDVALAYVASSKPRALEFIRKNPDYGGPEFGWWAVSREPINADPLEVKGPRIEFYDKDGNRLTNQPSP